MLVGSCLSKKSPDGDAGTASATVNVVVDPTIAEASAPVPAPTATALATNEGNITRFPDETPIANEPATLQRAYHVREAPPAGAVVAGLAKGTPVTKIASRDRYVLVLFDNAKAPGTKEMAWIHRDAFIAVREDAGPLVCPPGEIPLSDDTPFCGKVCTSDRECPPEQACKGQANKLLATGKAGDGVIVCTVIADAGRHDATSPVVARPTASSDAH
jgi:hypothetical protein